MKYIEEFRNDTYAKEVADRITQAADPSREYKFMEFCGGHTHAIYRYGIPSLLPSNVQMVHGPGCPVCVLPMARVDHAIALAHQPNVIFCSYSDMLRVPGSRKNSLLKAKAEGADVRMVYSIDDALRLAKENSDKEVIFFSIGFETTTPPSAAAVLQADREGIKNFSIFCNHVLTPPALKAILEIRDEKGDCGVSLNGFVGPAHVSVVIGSNAYLSASLDYKKPIVIAGFEPLDVLHAILMLIQQVNEERYEVENQYTRAVTPEGNQKAQAMMHEVFELASSFEWRGLGWIPSSALCLKEKYADYDASIKFKVEVLTQPENTGCECGAILRGMKRPNECKLFGKVCNPENPIGACMVSSEGACAAFYTYGRHQEK
ncbi:MAG: hydrogenase formation protein HypD [Gammaproteobacteria bacterium]|nr:hydrogenase formation protein HypD [Gammaproteobacteria bacterium]MBU1628943.1 hydrogenase formation protein HypD [Gammaproteobacteria bacterium]MBU2545571.1 hydrogenase formation protein HypD [Gammaproteobacteria bacterium]